MRPATNHRIRLVSALLAAGLLVPAASSYAQQTGGTPVASSPATPAPAGSPTSAAPSSPAPAAPVSPAAPATPAVDNEVPGATPIAAPTPAVPPAAEKQESTPAPVGASTDAGLQLLSPFPADAIRGMEGGSLWLTYHGLQWPYHPRTGIAVSGYVWLDTGYEKLQRGEPGQKDLTYWLQEGRAVLRVTPTYMHGSYFIQGQAELVANKDQSQIQPSIADVDDVWIKVGKWNRWDIQVGRFQTWEVVHLGMGLDLNTMERKGAYDEKPGTPEMYIASYMWDRPAGPGRVAAHIYPTRYLRFEMATEIGAESGNNTLGARPAAILDLGRIKLKAAYEYKRKTSIYDDIRGETLLRGGGAGILLLPTNYLELGANAGWGMQDVTRNGSADSAASTDTYTFGGFVNARAAQNLIVGAGAQLTFLSDFLLADGRYGYYTHYQAFGAVQYLLMGQLYLKAVVGWAQSRYEPSLFPKESFYENNMLNARFRVMYLF